MHDGFPKPSDKQMETLPNGGIVFRIQLGALRRAISYDNIEGLCLGRRGLSLHPMRTSLAVNSFAPCLARCRRSVFLLVRLNAGPKRIGLSSVPES